MTKRIRRPDLESTRFETLSYLDGKLKQHLCEEPHQQPGAQIISTYASKTKPLLLYNYIKNREPTSKHRHVENQTNQEIIPVLTPNIIAMEQCELPNGGFKRFQNGVGPDLTNKCAI